MVVEYRHFFFFFIDSVMHQIQQQCSDILHRTIFYGSPFINKFLLILIVGSAYWLKNDRVRIIFTAKALFLQQDAFCVGVYLCCLDII